MASLLSAQSTSRKTTTTTASAKSALAPASTGKSQKMANNTSTSSNRSSTSNAPSTSTSGVTSRKSNSSTTERSTQAAYSGYTRTSIARPSLGTGPGSTKTAKSIGNSTKKAPVLKPAETIKINWLTIEQAVEKNKTEKRKIFIDVYTVWCGWCKHMDSTTFVNPTVAAYINEHYYPVKFDAEQQQDIVFKDKTYHYQKEGARGYHELAALWLNNRLSYPTVVFLDENLGIIQPLAGYLDATKLEAILNYFGTDSHKTTPWETYERKFGTGGR